MPVLSLKSCKRKGINWPFSRFSGGHLRLQRGTPTMARSGGNTGFAGLTCFACQLCENMQFAFECHSCLLSAFASIFCAKDSRSTYISFYLLYIPPTL